MLVFKLIHVSKMDPLMLGLSLPITTKSTYS